MDSVINFKGIGNNNDDLNISEIDLTMENDDSLEVLDTSKRESTEYNDKTENNKININALSSNVDFGPLKQYIASDDIVDVSYSNDGKLLLKSVSKGTYVIKDDLINDLLIEKIAVQCSKFLNIRFDIEHPLFLFENNHFKIEFIHKSISSNGIMAYIHKITNGIELNKEKMIENEYINKEIHNLLVHCVEGNCNIIVCGKPGSGKTELVKYLASYINKQNKIITVENILELRLNKVLKNHNIISLKSNSSAGYYNLYKMCQNLNPNWFIFSEIKDSDTALTLYDSIISGYNVLSTMHCDRLTSIPNIINSYISSKGNNEKHIKNICRFLNLGVMIRERYLKDEKNFVREVCEICEFYVDENNEAKYNLIYKKNTNGTETFNPISKYMLDYLEYQGVDMKKLKNGE